MNEDLKKAFGNEGWIAGDLYREVMLDIASQSARTLELGSGLTTLDLARAGNKGVTLEHLPEWIGYVEGVGSAMEVALDNFRVKYSPLKDYGPFEWYNYVPIEDGINVKYDFVVCDGPPRDTTTGARVGLIDVMKDNLSKGCLILYDDYDARIDPGEPEVTVTQYWEENHGVTVEEIFTPGLMDGKPFALLKMP